MSHPNFPLEKILTVTPSEYCASAQTELKYYSMVGVHAESYSGRFELFTLFRGLVPQHTEVVVGLILNTAITESNSIQYASGTALIPRSIPLPTQE